MRAGIVTAQVSFELKFLGAARNVASVRPVRTAEALALLVGSGAGAFSLEIDVIYARRYLFVRKSVALKKKKLKSKLK